jgi:hypothetical protein
MFGLVWKKNTLLYVCVKKKNILVQSISLPPPHTLLSPRERQYMSFCWFQSCLALLWADPLSWIVQILSCRFYNL